MPKILMVPVLGILVALAACSSPTPVPETPVPETPVQTSNPAPTEASEPTKYQVPTGPPAEASSGDCGELCKKEFWKDEVTVASVQAELDAGADPTAKGHGGTPALFYAVESGSNPGIVRLLLEHGADPNIIDDQSGQPPLHSVVELTAFASSPGAGMLFSGDPDDLVRNGTATIGLLLQSGADAGARDKDGRSALLAYLASIGAWFSIVDAEIVRLLLEHGTRFVSWNDTDALVIPYAMDAKAGPEVIGLLLEYGAGDVVKLFGGDTLLHMAAVFTAGPQVFSVLLEEGYDVNAEGELAVTPLHAAILNEEIDPQVIRVLLDSGADVSARSDGGPRPCISPQSISARRSSGGCWSEGPMLPPGMT